MKLPPFDHSKMEWDSWRAFHIEHKYHAFIQFDTGEFVVRYNSWRPENRKVYSELHIQIVATDDDECPKLYIPGSTKPVFKSHLNHKGQQTLLLDLDHKRAVSLSPELSEDNAPLVPVRFTEGNHNVTAWYAGPDAVPVGAPIIRHYPQPLLPYQREHIKELVDASKVWMQMQPNLDTRKRQHPDLKVGDFVDVSFAALTTEHRMAIATVGFNTIVKEEHPWLTFNLEEGVTEHE
jgi:hypothetical protein